MPTTTTWTHADAAALAKLQERRRQAITPLALQVQTALSMSYDPALKIAEALALDAKALVPLMQALLPPASDHEASRQQATILAALRYWQQSEMYEFDKCDAGHLWDIASDSNTYRPLNLDEIDVLCADINLSTRGLPLAPEARAREELRDLITRAHEALSNVVGLLECDTDGNWSLSTDADAPLSDVHEQAEGMLAELQQFLTL